MLDKSEANEQLNTINEAKSAAWTNYPKTPNWFYPLIGLAQGCNIAGVVAFLTDNFSAAKVASLIAGAFLLVLAVNLYTRKRGQFPSGKPPKELSFTMALTGVPLFSIATLLLVPAAASSVWYLAPPAGIILFSLAGLIYEPLYRNAAEKAISGMAD